MKNEANLTLLSVVEDTGMKIFELEEEKIEFSFCSDTTNREKQLHCIINNSGRKAKISVCGTPWMFPIPQKGRFYYVICEGKFVHTFPMISCFDRRVMIRTGRYICELEEDRGSYMGEDYVPICMGEAGLDYDGSLLLADRPIPCSQKRNPVVYVRDGIVIDSQGLMLLPKKHRYPYNTELPLIAALSWGRLCITADRRILCQGERTLEEADSALDIAICDHGYAVQTKCGDVYFSTNGRGWQIIGDHASAIAAYGDLVAWADTDGTVFVYCYRKNSLGSDAILRFPGRFISEIDISTDLVALKFLDGSFDVVSRKNGKTVLGDLLVTPDLPEL